MIRDALISIKEYLEKKMGGVTTVELDTFRKVDDGKEHDLIITLLHIEEETSRKQQTAYWTAPATDAEKARQKEEGGPLRREKVLKTPDIDVNLEILVSSHARQYETALSQISEAIRLLNTIRTDTMPSGMGKDSYTLLRKLNISMMNVTLDQTLSMWQTMGCGVFPGALFKVRMLTVTGARSGDNIKLVSDVSFKGNIYSSAELEEKKQEAVAKEEARKEEEANNKQ